MVAIDVQAEDAQSEDDELRSLVGNTQPRLGYNSCWEDRDYHYLINGVSVNSAASRGGHDPDFRDCTGYLRPLECVATIIPGRSAIETQKHSDRRKKA